ncbi:hypothetical protein SDC9_196178 [bioreactor metagenome]|uniref:Uncharacterized protein n=1 Tax=bioreactor metagenome TaxID=1076179 RepID=A0A645IBB4_9ZZZZ
MTVTAADMAMQKARIWSSSVISLPTVRISFGPYSVRPSEMPMAPTSMTQSGMPALADSLPWITVSAMAASGPMALATSLAP